MQCDVNIWLRHMKCVQGKLEFCSLSRKDCLWKMHYRDLNSDILLSVYSQSQTDTPPKVMCLHRQTGHQSTHQQQHSNIILVS